MNAREKLFNVVLDMSLTGGIVILLVIFIRLFMQRFPKKFSYLLWAVVLLRLLSPVSFSSALSVFRVMDTEVTKQGRIVYLWQENMQFSQQTGSLPSVQGEKDNSTVKKETPVQKEKRGVEADRLSRDLPQISANVWLSGITFLWIYNAVSLIRLKKSLVAAVREKQNIYLCDYIGTAFVLGIFRPRIYLPTALSAAEREYILLHEQTHIKRRDHIFRLLAFLALSIHWFNPLVWCAFFLSERDMEMSCDEAVMQKMGTDMRAAYSASLLNVAGGRKVFVVAPPGFGEGNVKCRIKNIMRYKKTNALVAVPVLVMMFPLFVALGSNPGSGTKLAETEAEKSERIFEKQGNGFGIAIKDAAVIPEVGDLSYEESTKSGTVKKYRGWLPGTASGRTVWNTFMENMIMTRRKNTSFFHGRSGTIPMYFPMASKWE